MGERGWEERKREGEYHKIKKDEGEKLEGHGAPKTPPHFRLLSLPGRKTGELMPYIPSASALSSSIDKTFNPVIKTSRCIKPCTFRGDHGEKIDGIDACTHVYADGQTVLIDFRSAARSLAPTCTCKLQALDDGFVTFALLNAPKYDDCNSMVSLTSTARDGTTHFECGQTSPTRVAFVEGDEIFMLTVSKMSTDRRDIQSEFCFKINGPLVDIAVRCSPDPLTITPNPNATTRKTTYTTTDPFTTTTDLTFTTTDHVGQTESPKQTDLSISQIFIAIPATVAVVLVTIAIIIAVVCIIKRNSVKNGSNYPTPCHMQSYSANSQYVGIPSKRGSDTVRSYERPVSNGYLTMVEPNTHSQSYGHGSMATNSASVAAGYVNENPQNHANGNSFHSRDNINTNYETNEYREDDENVYDVIQDVVYANVTDSESNRRHGDNEVVHYNKVIADFPIDS
ncbi:hypothetical protein FSP39_005270 [Pinctada imbricata]|uniref:Uncharacterized protein n=1 Tax=Pinctada imbricata TaxID=66713 RepID=A0AA88YTG8_PINIB|nr:hypothetical protein FSP39_005270 [Pinctada imbricata]